MALKKRTASEASIIPDAVYGSRLATKFMNCLMWQGKKATAQRLFYNALEQMQKRLGEGTKVIEVFEQAVENVKPTVEVRSRRVGGATYQVPMTVNPRRKQSLAIRWIITAARSKKGKPMSMRLAEELLAAYRREGDAMTKRENTIKMADANKAFAHFAW